MIPQINLLASYLLDEDKSLFNLSWFAWVPVILSAAVIIAGLGRWAWAKFGPKRPTESRAITAQPKSIDQLRAEAYRLLDQLSAQIASEVVSPPAAAELLSAICRDYIDGARLLGTKAMTLREAKQDGMPSWLGEVMARCYEHEFNPRTVVPVDQLPGVIAYAKGQIGLWP